MRAIRYIDIELMERMCHPIAVAVFDTASDPIAQFNKYEFSLLDSALKNPQHTFSGKELYPTFESKAAILYYGLIKNHPFHNGNKRLATATLLVFLFINKLWLTDRMGDNEDYLVSLAQRVASSRGDDKKNKLLRELQQWLKTHIKKRL